MAVTVPRRRGDREDDGVLGPESVAWEVFSNPPAVVLGSYRSIAYTALSPGVSQAVLDQGYYRSDPLRRARESAYWFYTSVFGDTAEAVRAGKWVDGRHARVKGFEPVTKTEYHPYRRDLAIAGHCLIWEG